MTFTTLSGARKSVAAAVAAAGVWLVPAAAGAVTITFENLAEGAVVSNQYAGLGVVFSANAFAGSNGNSTPEGWATNTGMTVTANDLSIPGAPGLYSGKLLHSFGNFLEEDGDPSIRATFALPVTSFSIDFVGIDAGLSADVTLLAYNGLQLIGAVVAAECAVTCQQTLSFSAPSITQVVFTPGSVVDWVGVDNISFSSAVPETGSLTLLTIGLGVLALRSCRFRPPFASVHRASVD